MTRIKICGLTRPQDVALACELGAEAVGFNFAAGSPRRVTIDCARGLSDAVAEGVWRVGVFMSEDASVVIEAVDAARLDLVQIHRPLREGDLESVRVPVIAVAGVGPGGPDLPAAELLSRCRALLFDTASRDQAGGTGEAFDWRLVSGKSFGLPIYLAGGLRADNVGEAIARVRPWAVDTASGVESAPGVKDSAEMRRFFEAVRRADAQEA